METALFKDIPFLVATVLALAAFAGIVIVILKFSAERRKMMKDYEYEKDKLQEKLEKASNEKARLESALSGKDEYLALLKESNEKAIEAQKEAQQEVMRQQKEQHEKEILSMKDAFKALSAENSASFKHQSAESISELLKPIQERFAEFDKAVKESQIKNAEQSADLKANIENVLKHSQAVGDEARNLANALTGYSKVQGDFGEMLLTDVLKNAGLQEGVHFFTQGVMTDEAGHEIRSTEGKTMIPDVMVFYPDDTTVIVDSKVSLNAYKDYINAEAVEDRKKFAKAHVDSIRKHVDELKNKDYASYLPEGRRKVKDNIMFIPMEGAFRLMLEEDPMLWQAAKDRNVLIVSQMTLIIVLNMIQMAWKQASQEKNISDVYRTAEELMSQISGWMDSYVALGEVIKKAQSAYDLSKKKLIDGTQSVVKKVQKLEKLGLTPKKSQAKLKPGARMTGPESIIPQALTPEGPSEISEGSSENPEENLEAAD